MAALARTALVLSRLPPIQTPRTVLLTGARGRAGMHGMVRIRRLETRIVMSSLLTFTQSPITMAAPDPQILIAADVVIADYFGILRTYTPMAVMRGNSMRVSTQLTMSALCPTSPSPWKFTASSVTLHLMKNSISYVFLVTHSLCFLKMNLIVIPKIIHQTEVDRP